MLGKLIYLNWTAFLSKLTKFQTFLVVGYIIFLLILFSNLLGSALVMVMFEREPMIAQQLPWLTAEIRILTLLVFSNLFWILHFSFTSTRLLNMEENRKLLAYGYPVNKLAGHLNLVSFFHPLNIIYNFTWLAFLLMQVRVPMYIPVVITVVLLNYAIIYSIKHRFLRVIEKRFKVIVFSGLFLVFGTMLAIAIISRNPGFILGQFIPPIEDLIDMLIYTPGGMMLVAATGNYSMTIAAIVYSFSALLIFLITRDHFFKTKEGLQNPSKKRTEKETGMLWKYLKQLMGHHAGKIYYYALSHPYNRLFLLSIVLIPAVYIPVLLHVEQPLLTAILVPTMLAAVPVALLAMGMANLFGYEYKELLLHKQFPQKFERQLKERFLGVIAVPLFIFYLLTIAEVIYLPQLGSVFSIYISNTFFFVCFMLIFLWSSFYHFQKVNYTSFSFKHPIISQKVTFVMSLILFGLGYTVFAPLGEYHLYRQWIMVALIIAICIYLWLNMEILVKMFNKKILPRIWNSS